MENDKILAQKALEGNQDAFRQLVNLVEEKVFNLAFRFLNDRMDAADATQEILIKAITRLNDYRGESRFSTWVYKIAVNHLLRTKQTKVEKLNVSFDDFAYDLQQGLTDEDDTHDDQKELIREIKFSCTSGMLICLDRPHRIAFILAYIFNVSSAEGSNLLDISPESYRKRASRAKIKLTSFMQKNCGLINPNNSCHCHRKLDYALTHQRIDQHNLNFSTHESSASLLENALEEIEAMTEIADLFRSHPKQKPSPQIAKAIQDLLTGGQRFSTIASWN